MFRILMRPLLASLFFASCSMFRTLDNAAHSICECPRILFPRFRKNFETSFSDSKRFPFKTSNSSAWNTTQTQSSGVSLFFSYNCRHCRLVFYETWLTRWDHNKSHIVFFCSTTHHFPCWIDQPATWCQFLFSRQLSVHSLEAPFPEQNHRIDHELAEILATHFTDHWMSHKHTREKHFKTFSAMFNTTTKPSKEARQTTSTW